MTLRKRTILFMIAILVVMILLLFSVSNLILINNFNNLEQKELSREIGIAQLALNEEIDRLDSTNLALASWDDTYQFIKNTNDQYIHNNLTDKNMTLMGLHFVLFYNNDGNCIYGKIVDLKNHEQTSLPKKLTEIITKNSRFINFKDVYACTKGFLILSDYPVLISCRPITSSDHREAILGTLISGVFLDASNIQQVGTKNNLSISLYSLSDPKIPPIVSKNLTNLEVTPANGAEHTSAEIVTGYTVIKDIYAQPAILLKVEMPRDIYIQGRLTINYFIIAFLLIGFVFMMLTLLYVDSSVLSRLRQLIKGVISIGKSSDLSVRVPVQGKDELSALAEEINSMLIKLDQSQEALNESQKLYATLVEKSNDGIAIIEDGLFKYVNSKIVEMYKSTPEELTGKSINNFIHPDYRQTTFDMYKRRIAGQDVPEKYETVAVTKDGTSFVIEISAKVIELNKKMVDIIVVRDVTQRKHIEEQLIIADRLASVGELASGIAHEINNPLTGVVGFSQLLLNENLPEHIKSDIEIINREAKRAAEVVKNLLIFSRKHDVELKPININEIIMKVLDLRTYEHKINNINVITKLSPNLPNVISDYYQMQQVFINIIINAEYSMINAHKGGSLTITTTKTTKNKVQITFSDDGGGIPKENVNHIFDPFFTTKTVGKGTGLGLSICYGIITKLKGFIHVESEVGKGAIFSIELPTSDQRSSTILKNFVS